MFSRFIILIFLVVINHNLFSQPRLIEQGRYFESLSFSKISADETGIWAISGDSSKIYHFDLNNTLLEYPQFNAVSSKKFTGILAKGSNKVLVATAGDYLLSFANGVVTKLGKSSGVLNGKINSLFGDLNNTIVGTDSLAYEAKGNYVFNTKYTTNSPDKKTVILNDYMTWGYPYAQKASRYSWANYYFQFNTYNAIYGSDQLLDNDEYPNSSSFYYTGSFYICVATNKMVRFFDRLSGGFASDTLLNTPTYDLYNVGAYVIAAAKDGLYIKYMYNRKYSVKVLDNMEIYDILCVDNRMIWLATNKGLVKMSIVPILTRSGTINFCESSPQSLQINNITSGDVIKWYRNGILTGFGNTASVTITQGGTYSAVVSNPVFPKADTTGFVNFRTDSADYSYSYSYDTITICKGGNWILGITTTDAKSYSWLKNGVKMTDQSVRANISEAGLYSVLITNCNNIDYETKRIEVKTIDNPYVTFNYPKISTICSLDTIKLNATSNADYVDVYYNNRYFTTNEKELNLTQAGTYTFRMRFQNIFGCYSQDTFKINLLPLPFAWVSQTGNSVNASTIIKNSDGLVKLSFKIKDYQWFLNNKLVNGATDSILHFNNTGIYKVKVTDFNGCSNFSNECAVLTLNTHDIDKNEFNVFPNPTTGAFTISANAYIKVNKIEIFNSLGLLVRCFEKDLDFPYTCNINDLANGIYLVRIVADKSSQFRIVLQK